MSRSLVVLPDAGVAPVLALLASAKVSLRVKVFQFDEPALLGAVVAAAQRGVAVRVLFNRAGHGAAPDNAGARAALHGAGAECVDASHKVFALVHEKSVVVDDQRALVQSADWSTTSLAEARDYGVVTTHRHEVDEIACGFDADWQHKHFKPHAHAHLLWCPLNGRERIAAFIDDARHSLLVQNERYQDPVII
jgi:cardiolipin synthase